MAGSIFAELRRNVKGALCYNLSMEERRILWTVTDPRGLSITLTKDVWLDIIRKHQDVVPYFDAIKMTAADPDDIYFDPESTTRRGDAAQMFAYYKSNVLSGAAADDFMTVIVKVVVEPRGRQGYVQTAYIIGRVLRRLVPEWKK